MNEKRQSMIQKLKAVEKDKEGLEGKKLEAEAYIGKQAERLRHQIMGNKGLMHKAQVTFHRPGACLSEHALSALGMHCLPHLWHACMHAA